MFSEDYVIPRTEAWHLWACYGGFRQPSQTCQMQGQRGMQRFVCAEDCPICKAFTAEQKTQLATPMYRARKEKEHSKKPVTGFPATSTPTLVDPKNCKLIGWVEG